MATFSKVKLSASTNGRGIVVAATATAGTLLHTATSTANELDELWLYAQNYEATEQDLTVELGGVTDPGDLIEVAIPPTQGLVQVTPGLILDGGVAVRAFCETASGIAIFGFVNRINQA